MRTPTSTASRLAALVGASAVVLTAGAFPAVAATSGSDNGVQVVNTETVQAYTDATGAVKSKRIYEQLALTGKGAVDLANPITTSGLRNLDGFGGFKVKGNDQMVDVKVDGEKNLRSVSDYKGDLPLDISIVYKLDGKEISPKSLVGKSGDLEVLYTVKNVTGRTQTISFTDGKGGTVEKQSDVIVPMVGSLTVGLPSTFRDVKSGEANMAGDGEGGTKLSYTMTLLAPLGSDTATFGYTAKVVDAIAPDASVSALPVNPLESPSFKTAGDSYKGGAQTGEELAAGAAEIDSNLLKLRDGAGDLLAGLIKLRNGAQQLRDGLQNEAAPGAAKLADGAGQLSDGVGQLKGGTTELRAGATKLNGGALKLDAGAGQLNGGLTQLNDGATKLDGGAKKLDTGAKKLQDGAGQLAEGSGTLATGAQTAYVGSQQIAAGQAKLLVGLQTLKAGVEAIDETVKGQLDVSPDYQRLIGTLGKIVTGIGSPSDTTTDTILGGLNLLKYGLRSPLGKDACDQDESTATLADDCGAADAAEIIAGKFNVGVDDISTSLLPAAVGSYQALITLAGCAPLVNGLPPVTNLALPGNNPCKFATVAALGYGAPDGGLQLGPNTVFEDGGLKVQADAAAKALTRVFEGLDSKALPGIALLKKALFNDPCDPTQTDKDAADFCGVSQAVQLIQQGIPTLVDTVVNGIQGQLLAGLGSADKGCNPEETLICAAAALAAGGADLAGTDGLGALSAGAGKLAAGLTDLKAGADQLSDGTGQLSGGTGDLLAGAGKLSAGAGKLADGTGQLADGTGQLSAGAGKLDDGAGKLADGAGQLDAGANKLADGLSAAAGGSGQLADGLVTAAGGAPKLVDGAQRLSTEGTKKLVAAGQDTAQKYGEQYALLVAGAKRAQEEKMVVGAPADAMGLAAYSYEIKGEDGEGSRNLMRGVAGLALLGAGGAVFALRRRLI
ncbi:hypothetical protein [Nocardioides marmoribigeumensis]|uniref:Membrane protein n=1 Tax=Nocardioides marmoribigeumensis TaxID=433649 RepID=A0ABU2BRI0_9ACTN|nr:hypothetical protein [Nocardioides marmoribigeumensis]MDR7361218.1 putative membrane protein [Nocardioides marmoribigeumensis]